jgi:hypothetical protein
MASQFVDVFRGSSDRAKFLARVFGIFSEDIVRLWAASPGAPYEDLGRPTIRFNGETTGSTLDFTFRHRASGKVHVAEMKCEIEYQGFRYSVLESPEQLAHHTKAAFRSFLRAAKEPGAATVNVRRRAVPIDGAILVWGAATPEGCTIVGEHHGFADVLTVESMIAYLTASNDARYLAMLGARRKWLDEMFSGLAAEKPVLG